MKNISVVFATSPERRCNTTDSNISINTYGQHPKIIHNQNAFSTPTQRTRIQKKYTRYYKLRNSILKIVSDSRIIEKMNQAKLYQNSNSLQKRDAMEILRRYSKKIRWRNQEDSVIDIGSGDGSITVNILKSNFSDKIKKIIGCDISIDMVKHANETYRDEHTSFIVQDIEAALPEELTGTFDHAFSFYTLHWIRDQEKAFTNIYNLLAEDGDCLLIFLGHMPVFDIYRIMSTRDKWKPWVRDVDRFISPYHDSQTPDLDVTKLMTKIGFKNIDVKCKEMIFVFDDVELLKKAVLAVNPFKIPPELHEDFLEDYLDVVRDMRFMDEANNNVGEDVSIRAQYTLLTAYATKLIQSKNRIEEENSSEEEFESKASVRSVSPPDPSALLDELIVTVKHIQVSNISEEYFDVAVSFSDKIIIKSTMMGVPKWVSQSPNEIDGSMFYDPSKYEEMSLFADQPLVVTASLKTKQSSSSVKVSSLNMSSSTYTMDPVSKQYINRCNIDIFPLFIDQEKMLFEKRMEPAVDPTAVNQKSWCNLPLITLEVSVKRNEIHAYHHEILKESNLMKMSIIGVYNMFIAYDSNSTYSIATHLPLTLPEPLHPCFFEKGQETPRRFNNCSFRPSWESMNAKNEDFTRSDEMLIIDLESVKNDDNIDLQRYFQNDNYSVIWGSFHRTLFFGDTIKWFHNYIRGHKWQLDLQLSGEYGTLGLFCPISLFNLLYPGENKITLAVPFQFASAKNYAEHSFTSIFHDERTILPTSKNSRVSQASTKASSNSVNTSIDLVTDGSSAFILLEVELYKPLKKIIIPPVIPNLKIKEMLESFENTKDVRICTGRGYHKEWDNIVNVAYEALKRVPYYGIPDIYAFNRQLSESRTRVEIITSFWHKASKYVNENFVLDRYMYSDDMYNELLTMAHVCLMKEAGPALVNETRVTLDPGLRAARHARQLQCTKYASHLYKQVLVDHPYDGDVWRELATCYKDFDIDCAFVCMQRAMACDYLHPLNLLSMGCMIMHENIEAAEPFFAAILSLYPFYITLWYCIYCYYIKRELFDIANIIMDLILKTKEEKLEQSLPFMRGWEDELGDWWDPTPITPAMNVFYDPADLLLRLRGFGLADVCLSQAVIADGDKETPSYRHLLALSCRLRGDFEQGLCHVRLGKTKFGQLSYLNSLEGECLYRLGDVGPSMAALKRAGYSIGPYGLLLSIPTREYPKSKTTLIELVQRQPSAYAWIVLAGEWLHNIGNPQEKENPIECAIACSVQALKYDRCFAYAWVLLAKLVTAPERRNYCRSMADVNRFSWVDDADGEDNTPLTCCVDYKILQECVRNINCCYEKFESE